MIAHLDNMLRHLFIAQIDEITRDNQVGFQPPDQDWRTHVRNLEGNALNVYLVDIRENRKLRSNEKVSTMNNGIVSETQAPRRIDCHYLITAWSPVDVTPAVEPTIDEHTLLYRVTGVLMNNEPLVPRRIYDPDPLPGGFPPEIADVELPTTILPVEGFPKLAEFWGTVEWRWKPGIYLIVTLPVILDTHIAGPMVTTRITEYRQIGKPDTAEVWIQIGGHVWLPPHRMAVGNATVTNISGNTLRVNNAAPFRNGDVVTINNTAFATIMQINNNDLILSNTLTASSANPVLRIGNITPLQATFRVDDIAGLIPGGTVIIRGDDANNQGTRVSDIAVIESISPTGIVTLRAAPTRTNTYNLNVPSTDAPTISQAAVGAWVRLKDGITPLQTTTTDSDGRFTFAGLRQGNYTLQIRVRGFAEVNPNIEVPSITGSYDVTLS